MKEVCVESFCKEKIVLLCKKILPDLIAPKMPGLKKKTTTKKRCLLFFPILHRQKMDGIYLFISGSSSRRQTMHLCHNPPQGILAHLALLVTRGTSTTRLQSLTYEMRPR